MVAFGFLPQNLGGGGDLQMILLLLYECSVSSVDNQSFQIFCTFRQQGCKNFRHKPLRLCPASHLVEFSLPYLLVSTYVVCERLSVMHEPAGVVEILVQIPQNTPIL